MKVKNLVVLDQMSMVLRKEAEAVGFTIFRYDEVLFEGKANEHPNAEVKPEDIFTLCFTSGSTGSPRAAMITHGNMIAALAGLMHQ